MKYCTACQAKFPREMTYLQRIPVLQGASAILSRQCQDDERQDTGSKDSTANSCQDATTWGHLLP